MPPCLLESLKLAARGTRPGHPADPSREMRLSADAILEHAATPTQVISNQTKQVHKWQICIQSKHRQPNIKARK
jgi:hypothetical protein